MYQAAKERYTTMQYNRCGKSGLKLPAVSFGFWHNFGDTANYEMMKTLCFTAFDHGITHFDLANNYGPARKRRDEPRQNSKGEFYRLSGRAFDQHKGRLSDVGRPLRRLGQP